MKERLDGQGVQDPLVQRDLPQTRVRPVQRAIRDIPAKRDTLVLLDIRVRVAQLDGLGIQEKLATRAQPERLGGRE